MNSQEIRNFRKEHDLTQSELAEIVGVKIGTVQSWEQGRRNVPQSTSKILEMYDPELDLKKKEDNISADRFESIVAKKVLQEFHPVIQQVLDSHNDIKKEVAKLILDIDDLMEENQELIREIQDLKKLNEKTHSLLK